MTDPRPRPAAGRAAAPRAGGDETAASRQPAGARHPGDEQTRLLPCDSAQRYVASWAEHKTPGGWGAASSWVPMTFENAKATLIAELRRNLGNWAGIGGSDPVRYSEALDTLTAAAGPVTIDLPGHVLSITEAPGRGQ